jgi:cell division septation protein DedD
MNSQERATQQLHDTLKEYFVQIRFARAAELARSGRYLEAEGLLSPNGRESSDPKELDLLARISARQRQYRRARRLWEIALERSPGNAGYERAIERTRDAERFQTMLRKGAMLALLGLAVIALFIAVWSSFHRHSSSVARGREKQTNIHATSTPIPSSSPQSTQPASTTRQPASTTPTPQSSPIAPQTGPPPTGVTTDIV